MRICKKPDSVILSEILTLLQLEIYPAFNNSYSHGGDLVLGFDYHDHGWIRSRKREVIMWRHGKLKNPVIDHVLC